MKYGNLVEIIDSKQIGCVIEVISNFVLIYNLKKEKSKRNIDLEITYNNECYIIDDISKIIVNINDIKIIGELSKKEIEVLARLNILNQVDSYYEDFHKKDDAKEFSRVPYGGRVYDNKEMRSLVDSALDFWLTAGRYNQRFEKEFAEYLGVRYALLTNSGSSANLLAFSTLTSPKLGDRRVKPGDEVITVAAGFPTTVAPMVQNNAVPVFVDVELGTYNIQVDQIESAITDKTKAIMIAHTMGNPFDLDKVMEIAKKYDLWVVEDNCDSLGSTFNGQLTGTFGHLATSSFYPPHHMTMGEGGAVYTNDPALKMIIESYRDWGRDCWCGSGTDNTCKKRFGWQLGTLPLGYDHKYIYSHVGYNLRVTDMQAAVGVEQLKKVSQFTEARKKNFNLLYEGLRELEEYLILPKATRNSDPSWFGFLMTVRDDAGFKKNDIVNYLEEKNIQTRMLFAGNLTRQPAFQDVNYRIHGELKNTDKIMNDTFLVGVYPGLTESMIEYVVDSIKKFIRK